MPLKGKYLQYRSEITFEIFEKIYNKLIEEKWCCKNSIKTEYPWFAKHGYITHEEPQEQRNFATHTCIYGLEETTVQEILGYDPFVKEIIEEVIPEYVECIKPQFWENTIKENNGNLIFDTKSFKFSYYSNTWKHAIGNGNHFKPSTKEAFDAQNKPKSIEKWSVGTYVLFLKNLGDFRAGYIDIINNKFNGSCTFLEKYLSMDISKEKDGKVKWLATKSEAEEFAKTLVEPVKKEVKQLLKQAVHCKTQEEWDFVSNKIGCKFINKFELGNSDTINPLSKGCQSKSFFEGHKEYQVLSFQEWCDLNGYKMEKEVKFEVGQLVWISSKPMNGNGMDLSGKEDGVYRLMDLDSLEFATGHLLENSHFKFKCGKNYFKTNIKNIRHATPEEINNHLISIGQIPSGEPLNTGIEPDKNGNWTWESQLADNSLATKENLEKAKMTLSIDDEELPMVNIIKTNTIKQLLNND